MGLLDEILKQLEEAQNEGRPRPQSTRVPEREMDADDSEDDEDEAARPSHAPHIPSRRVEPVAELPEPPPMRTTIDAPPAVSPHERGVASALHIRAMLSDRSSLRDALVMREILGPPPGLKWMRR